MPFPRKRSPIQLSEQEMLKLESVRKSRTEEKRRTLRAAFLLDSLAGQSDEAIAHHHHVSRSTVVRCIQKFLQFGLDSALGELPRPGKPRQLADDAIVWVQHCACQKPKELGQTHSCPVRSGTDSTGWDRAVGRPASYCAQTPVEWALSRMR